jgi:DNA primase
MKAMEKGIKNIVAIGNNTMTSYQFSVISRYASNIIMLLDNDAAGVNGRKTTIAKFGQFANIQNFYIPESYKDIDEYLTKCDDESPSFVVKD